MSRFRVTVTRIGIYEVESPDPVQAGNAALRASLSDPGPHTGVVMVEDAVTGRPMMELDLSKMEPAGSA